MNTPLVSVIVPVYNVAPYLEQCLDSIVNQTYRHLEIILVDDGSTDESGAICDRYAEQDSRIKVVHKENGGQSSARNVALDMMMGEWVLFVDSDDWIELNALELLFDQKDERADIVEFGFSYNYLEEESNQLLYEDMLCSGSHALKLLALNEKPMGIMCDKLFRTETLGNLRFIEGRYYEDTPFVIEFLWKSKFYQYIPSVLYRYRRDRTGQTTYKMVADIQKHMHQNLENLMERYANEPEMMLYLSTWYLNRSKKELLTLYTEAKEDWQEFKLVLGPHWKLACSMPFIKTSILQNFKLRAFQYNPYLYASVLSCLQSIAEKLKGRNN